VKPRSTASQLPNRLRELRKQKGWSQGDLAAKVGCSTAHISELEREVTPFTLYWMRLLAKPLDCSPVDILGSQDNPSILSSAETGLIEIFRAGNTRQKLQIAKISQLLVFEVND
jgi:repressor LexA